MTAELICRCRRRLGSGFELNADFRIPVDQSPVTVLFGPSGSGKTTLLRLIAGLDRADSGGISLHGRDWSGLSPQERRAAFLFQDYALFPHLSVAANVAYAARPGRAAELIQAFGLSDLADRRPNRLSGGQQQRVALARALAADPALLLLDEPLSALDAPTRTKLRYELRRMLLDSGVPAIVVTHDRMEAVALGDWIAVIVDGQVRQVGPIQEVSRRPADAQVAASLGVENVLPATIAGRDGGLLTLQVGPAQLQCVDAEVVSPVYACIHAEDVALTPEPHGSSARNCIAAHVSSVTVEGPLARVELDCGFPLVALITAQSAADLGLRPGDALSAVVKATAVHLIAG